MSRRLRSSRPGRLAQWGLIVLGLLLALFFLGGFGTLRLLAELQNELVRDNLERVGRQLTDPPPQSFYFLEFLVDADTGELDRQLLVDYKGTLAWEELDRDLRGAVNEPTLAIAALLSPTGEPILVRTAREPGPGFPTDLGDRDVLAIAQAATGVVSEPNAPQRIAPFRRLYFPVRAPDSLDPSSPGPVVAVLQLAGDPAAFRPLFQVRNRLLFGFGITLVLFLATYWMTVRLVRRTLHAERMAGQADRLRALGSMTAGIAHEIRNPLNILTLQAEELEASLADVPEAKLRANLASLASDIRAETLRLKSLTEEFVHFARASSEKDEGNALTNVAEVVEETVRRFGKGLHPELHSLHVRIDADRGLRARFPEDRLRQILLNLLRNAQEALGPRKGEVDVRVSRVGDGIEILVNDNGPGMDATTASQVFDPFFTTRAEGTGLGLSLSRAYAETAGGSLTLKTAPEKGATFLLRLPVVDS